MKSLQDFFRVYRSAPDRCQHNEHVRRALHHFLFARDNLDAPFASLSADAPDVLIVGDSDVLSLLVNVPWELADGVPEATRADIVKPLHGTLAGSPLARLRKGASASALNVQNERLRLLYCISEPVGEGKIGAPKFQQAIEQTLRERSGMLDYAPVVGTNFSPRFHELEAQLDRVSPHILVTVCHGRTTGGKPQLRFEEWINIERLAERLLALRKTFLVLLIACDQVFLDKGSSAHSGALVMVEKGVPAVVAMQSFVRVDLAAAFLGSFLDHFFHLGNIARAVAEGRKQMAPGRAVDSLIDWSLPALFLTEDASESTARLATSLKFLPALEAMVRSIPPPTVYFCRPALKQRLEAWMKPGTAGLRVVSGGVGTGKTTAVCGVYRQAITRAISLGDASFRPILYVDFHRYRDPVHSGQDLLAILRDRTEEIKPFSGATLISEVWPAVRSPDGTGQARHLTRQLLEIVDSNRMILILDHITDTASPFWTAFFEQARALSNASVIVIRKDSRLDVPEQDVLRVVPFTREETGRYLEEFFPEQKTHSDLWFEKSGGIPLLLNAIIRLNRGQLERTPALGRLDSNGKYLYEQTTMLISDLSTASRAVLCQMAHLPNGVNSELAWEYLGDWQMADVPELIDRGLLTDEYRFSVRWLSVSGLILEALHETFRKEVAEAGRLLASNFIDRISGDDGEVESNLSTLAGKPGGLKFLQDIHALLVALGYEEQFRAIPMLLHEWLFQRGRWNDALRLWERTLSAVPLEQTMAIEWILLAKAAHVLGMGARANACLDNADDRGPNALERIDILLQRAAVIKDSGATERADEVTEMYDRAMQWIEEARDGADEETIAALQERHGIATYNRALHRRYWAANLEGALADLKQAADEFAATGKRAMQALSDCEWAEVQLDVSDVSGYRVEWERVQERLIRADQVFAAQDAAGDRAFCNYQLARYYRRRPPGSADDARTNLLKARDAYRMAAKQAVIASDLRQQQIAEAHIVEISWRELREMSGDEAARRLDGVIRLLKTFEGDIWSSRVLRDALVLRARAGNGTSLQILEEAWQLSTAAPLKANRGEDARRAAGILYEYLSALAAANELFSRDKVAVTGKQWVEGWLGRSINPSDVESWLEDVRLFGLGAGGP